MQLKTNYIIADLIQKLLINIRNAKLVLRFITIDE